MRSGFSGLITVRWTSSSMPGLTRNVWPGAAAVRAGEQGAVLHAREDRSARRLDQDGVDVLVGQRPVGDVPAPAGGVTLESDDALDGPDQNLPGGSGGAVHRGAAMRKRDCHERLLRI